jgi:hypothetical protein
VMVRCDSPWACATCSMPHGVATMPAIIAERHATNVAITVSAVTARQRRDKRVLITASALALASRARKCARQRAVLTLRTAPPPQC